MRKLLLKILFSKSERQVIWSSVTYSEHTYRRRNGYAPKEVTSFLDRNYKIFAGTKSMKDDKNGNVK